ncbi:MAG: hypothetical protein ACRYGF_14590 [Janthinobacterium lividum]
MVIGQQLGFLLGGIQNGTINSSTKNAFFKGHEFVGTTIAPIGENCYFLKMDVSSLSMLKTKKSLQGATRGSSGRVFVKFDNEGNLVPGFAALWNHDDKAWLLDEGFFKRAKVWM